MLYAMSDIHGCQIAFARRIAQLEAHGFFEEDSADVLVLLGDYLDRGPDGLGVIRTIMATQRWTEGRVVALMGNHENEFLYWIGEDEENHVVFSEQDDDPPILYPEDDDQDDEELFSFRGLPPTDPSEKELPREFYPWLEKQGDPDLERRYRSFLMADRSHRTIMSFLGLRSYEVFRRGTAHAATALGAFDYACQLIRENHSELIAWMRDLPDTYETDRQIFVHAGIDESAGDAWRKRTTRSTLLGSKRTPFGAFPKDIVAGHVNTASISGDPDFHDTLWDGQSHFYLDGATSLSKFIPVLAFDEKSGAYGFFDEYGDIQKIRARTSR